MSFILTMLYALITCIIMIAAAYGVVWITGFVIGYVIYLVKYDYGDEEDD